MACEKISKWCADNEKNFNFEELFPTKFNCDVLNSWCEAEAVLQDLVMVAVAIVAIVALISAVSLILLFGFGIAELCGRARNIDIKWARIKNRASV